MKMQARAFAPASAGNAIAGFDLLGHSITGPRDIATVRRIDLPEVRIDAIRGSAVELPMEPERNTASAALIALREALAVLWGFAIELDKGIPSLPAWVARRPRVSRRSWPPMRCWTNPCNRRRCIRSH